MSEGARELPLIDPEKVDREFEKEEELKQKLQQQLHKLNLANLLEKLQNKNRLIQAKNKMVKLVNSKAALAAIKKHADVAMYVDLQMRKAVAERAVDAHVFREGKFAHATEDHVRGAARAPRRSGRARGGAGRRGRVGVWPRPLRARGLGPGAR